MLFWNWNDWTEVSAPVLEKRAQLSKARPELILVLEKQNKNSIFLYFRTCQHICEQKILFGAQSAKDHSRWSWTYNKIQFCLRSKFPHFFCCDFLGSFGLCKTIQFFFLGLCEASKHFYARMVLWMLLSTVLGLDRIWDFHISCEMLPMLSGRICHPLSNFAELCFQAQWEKRMPWLDSLSYIQHF